MVVRFFYKLFVLMVIAGLASAQDIALIPTPVPDIFLKHEISKDDIYVGEQISYTLELYSKYSLSRPKLRFSAPDFYQRVLDEKQSSENLNGSSYSVHRLRIALYPEKDGDLTIPLQELDASVLRERQNFPDLGPLNVINPFALPKREGLILKTESLSLHVKTLPPLPSETQVPLLFQIPVGKTSMDALYSTNSIKVGDARKIVITIQSEGNLDALSKVEPPDTESFRIHGGPPKVTYDEESGYIVTKKVYSLSLTPLRSGLISIPKFSLVYFNPEQGRYRKLETKEKIVEVKPVSSQTTEGIPKGTSAVAQTPVIETTLQYKDTSLFYRLAEFLSPSMFCLLFIALVLTFITLYMYLKPRHEQVPTGAEFFRMLRQAQSMSDLDTLFRDFLAYVIKCGPSALGLRAQLTNKFQSKELKRKFSSLLDDLDLTQYLTTQESLVKFPGFKKRVQQIFEGYFL